MSDEKIESPEDKIESLEDHIRSMEYQTESLEDHIRSMEDQTESLEDHIRSMEDQLAMSVAMLVRMSPWKILTDKPSRRVSIETPHGEVVCTYSERHDSLFAQLPASSRKPDVSCSAESNKDRMMQVVASMDNFHRQLSNVR